MKFQVLNEEGNALSMGELDKEAAEFFGVSYDEERYAIPSPSYASWYDVIGYNITSLEKGMWQWNDIINQFLNIWSFNTSSVEQLERIIKVFEPYLSLCYHWKSKGYIPVCL